MTLKHSAAQERQNTAVAIRAEDARLDAALADTFPASDPVAITVCKPPCWLPVLERSPAAGESW